MRAQGFHLENQTGYMALIIAPKFRRGHCGRQAASDGSLCVPMEEDKRRRRWSYAEWPLSVSSQVRGAG